MIARRFTGEAMAKTIDRAAARFAGFSHRRARRAARIRWMPPSGGLQTQRRNDCENRAATVP
jgi:hypothetical protein